MLLAGALAAADAACSLMAGKRALITGASSGIGLATVRVFVKAGATVCATGRNQQVLARLAEETGCSYVRASMPSIACRSA